MILALTAEVWIELNSRYVTSTPVVHTPLTDNHLRICIGFFFICNPHICIFLKTWFITTVFDLRQF